MIKFNLPDELNMKILMYVHPRLSDECKTLIINHHFKSKLKPNFTMFFNTNLPDIMSESTLAWRRIRIIPFESNFERI